MPMPQECLVLEILKQDNALKMSVFSQDELAKTLRRYSQCIISGAEIQDICAEVISTLNKSGRCEKGEPHLIKNLQKAGQLLWDHLLTRQVKERLGSAQACGLMLLIDEELIDIPWELLYDGRSFLCLKFSLGRLVRTENENCPSVYRSLPGVPRMLILANPTNDLKSAYLEGINIRNILERKRQGVRVDFKSTQIDKMYVKKNICDYDLVHFAGHCEYDPCNQRNSGWVLNDGVFNAHDILAMANTVSLPTLIFSNACYSAKGNQSQVEALYQQSNYSLAQAFLFSGVRHYIGSIRKIEDRVSLSFAREFYSQLISGCSTGEALRQGRLRLIKEYGLGSIHWTNYLLYGDPNFILFGLRHARSRSRPEWGIKHYRRQIAFLSLLLVIMLAGLYLFRWLPTVNPNTFVRFIQAQSSFEAGKNQEAALISSGIIKKEPGFLAAYPMLAEAYLRMGEREKALKYYFDYAFFSEKRNDKKNLAKAYIALGWFYQQGRDFSKAEGFYKQAIKLSADIKDKLMEAVCLRKMAVLSMDKNNFAEALTLLTKSSEINRERRMNREHLYNLACDYFDLGLVFVEKDDYPAAREFYEKSKVIFENLRLKNELSDCYFNLGEICLYEKSFQKALDHYNQGIKIDYEQGNKMSLAADYNMLGELFAQMDKIGEATAAFEKAADISIEAGMHMELACAYRNLGMLQKARGNKSKAKELLRSAQEIYSSTDRAAYDEVKKEIMGLSE